MSVLMMRRPAGWLSVAIVVFLALIAAPAQASGDNQKPDVQDKRVKIDTMAKETLDRLFKEDRGAQTLFEKAHGYAVFDNLKLSLFLSGGGGAGVAVDRTSGARTYMKMGTAGLNIAFYQLTESGLMLQADISGTKYWKYDKIN